MPTDPRVVLRFKATRRTWSQNTMSRDLVEMKAETPIFAAVFGEHFLLLPSKRTGSLDFLQATEPNVVHEDPDPPTVALYHGGNPVPYAYEHRAGG